MGIDLLQVLNGGGGMSVPGTGQETEMTLPDTRTEVTDNSGGGLQNPSVPSANSDAGKEFVARVLGSNNRVWGEIIGANYQKPKLVLFDGFVQSACGNAQAAMGPFYCPGDQKVYIDLSFYQDMEKQLQAPGDFAWAYVIAHEVGHHVQHQLGTGAEVDRVRREDPDRANEASVRLELQADCYAGVWAHGVFEAGALEAGDVDEAIRASEAVGDDRLQRGAGRQVDPDSFTHGSSAQRRAWFERGRRGGEPADCDTFAAERL
jgi:uncharacterized protein